MMTLAGLFKRLDKLEVAYPKPLTDAEQAEAAEGWRKRHTLLVLRHTWESREEVLARWEIDENEWGNVSVLVWPVARHAPKPMVRPEPGEMCLLLQEHERILQEAHAELDKKRQAWQEHQSQAGGE